VNKVNVSNIKNLVEELFQENLIRGRGVLVRSMIRAQMASPGFTHVFAALMAVINSKLPEIGDLLIRRVILQFRRAYKRNDKIVTTAVIKFMAHLVNQKVVSELLALHVATLLLERVTDDSIEVCVSFLQECGQALKELSPAGSMAIFERFRTILHEGEIDRRVQYVIEGLFEVRRKNFSDFPMLLEDLDLVDEEDQITHEVDLLDETIKGEETLNIFKAQPPEQYAVDEAKWKGMSAEILGTGDGEADGSDSSDDSEDDEEAQADQAAATKITDCTEQDLVNLRRSIYLVIQSSLHFEECVHKLLKLNISEGQEKEVCTMLIDCCAMDRMFNRFFVLQAERLCRLNPVYQERFEESFGIQFNTVHRLETNKLRNIGKFFAHLLFTDGISWSILSQVRITEETTTSSSRIFIKVIFQELSEQWGIKKLRERLLEPELQDFFSGLFPKDHPKNVRFAINYFTAIGLGVLTEELRQFLEKAPAMPAKIQAGAMEDLSTDGSDSDSSSSSSSSSS
jgi:pre-mRNA-splicing factor CWC22